MLDWGNGEISARKVKAQQFYTDLDLYQQC